MADAMVTSRMPQEKKSQVARILQREGLSASQAIGLMYDRIIEENGTSFLADATRTSDDWSAAARFVDSLSRPQSTRFDAMTDAEIKVDRLRSRGLM